MSFAPAWRIVAALALLGGLGGCTGLGEPKPETLDAETGKVGIPTPITELDWLVEECPLLADATAVVYYGGYYGVPNERVQLGPHDFWRDLVVTLPEDAADKFVEVYGLEPRATRPNVVSLLLPEVPSGVLLSSDEFDDAVCLSYHRARAWVSVEQDTVVLTTMDT